MKTLASILRFFGLHRLADKLDPPAAREDVGGGGGPGPVR